VDCGVAALVGHARGNAFLPVLFLLATVLSGEAVLPEAQNTDVCPAAFGMLLTPVYAAGLLFRPRRRIVRMGVGSLVVLVLYLVGVVALFAVATTQ
jgi:cation:H+ antiporter